MKNSLKYFIALYFKKIFPIAILIAIVTFFFLLMTKKLNLETYLSYLFFEGGGLLILGFFFSLTTFGRASQLREAFYYPTSNTIKDIRRDWRKEISSGLIFNLLGLTLLALLFLIYGFSLLFK